MHFVCPETDKSRPVADNKLTEALSLNTR